MNKPKAPKDMTVDEFIDLVEKRYHTEDPTNMNAWINTLRMIAEEPAPNPFTPDQLAWMRVEYQSSGAQYAVQNENGEIALFPDRPHKETSYNKWLSRRGHVEIINPRITFLSKLLSWEDEEPLCFSDYAPLNGPCEGGEKE